MRPAAQSGKYHELLAKWPTIRYNSLEPTGQYSFIINIVIPAKAGTLSIRKEWVGRSPVRFVRAGGKSEQDRATVVANGHPGRPAGKCHRKYTADGSD